MSRLKIAPIIDELAHKETSAGVKFKDVPIDARHEVEWIEGCHVFNRNLPTLNELPVPRILYQLPTLHPDRPRGSAARPKRLKYLITESDRSVTFVASDLFKKV